jgi:hypothetical protein
LGDESAIRPDYHSGTAWDPKGKTPVIKTAGARFSVNMLSAVSGKGHMGFMATDKTGGADVFIDFLKRLLFKQEKPVFLIIDGHPAHKSKKVKEYVQRSGDRANYFICPGIRRN